MTSPQVCTPIPALPSDLLEVTALVDAAYRGYIPLIGMEPGPMRDDYAAHLQAGYLHVLRLDGALAGILVLIPKPDHLLLDNVAVAPGGQGKGIGTCLMDFAEAEARRLGLNKVRLYTHEAMTRNIAIYTARGYRESHRAEERGLRRVFMEKPLR